MSKTDPVCAGCQQYKYQLRMRKSRLMPNTTLLLCNDCFEKKIEPREHIILVGRFRGIDSVSEYLHQRRYVGAEITGKELSKKK